MNKLLEILRQHKDIVSYTLSFNNPEMLTIKFKDGTEIVDEYSLYSEEIISKRVKKLKMTGKEEWIVEIGEANVSKKEDDFLIQENTKNVKIN